MSEGKNKSCLWVGVRLFLVLLVIFLIGNGYAAVRMQWTKMEMFRVARQLGFTDESLLRVGYGNCCINLVTGSALFEVYLTYSTQLDEVEFQNNLLQINPLSATSDGNYADAWDGRIGFLERQGARISGQASPIEDDLVTAWIVPREFTRHISFYELSKSNQQIEYKGQKITGNLASISLDVGRFPGLFLPVSAFGLLIRDISNPTHTLSN